MTEDDLQVAALARAPVLSTPGAKVWGDGSAEFSSVAVPRNQPRPTYNEATDGNRFAWILKAAKAVRIQEQAANEVRRIRLQASRRCAMPALFIRGDAK